MRQHSATEQVSLMHKLVSMSDDDRERLVDRFWDEVCDGLNVHPAFAELLHQSRPKLPDEPTTEQLEAWIELADLVRDDGFRRSARAFFHATAVTTGPRPDDGPGRRDAGRRDAGRRDAGRRDAGH